MKFGYMKNSVRKIYLQKSSENEGGRLVPDLFLSFLNKLYIW